MSCTLCGASTTDLDRKCTFCRVRDHFWVTLDDLPPELRGWGVTNLQIWSGIIHEELDKYKAVLAQRREGEATAAPKSRALSPGQRPEAPRQGSKEVEKEKSPLVKREEERHQSPAGKPAGVKDLEDSPGAEGKYSSSARGGAERRRSAERKKASSRSRRRRSKSRSRRRRKRSKSRVAREEKPKDKVEEDRGKEKKAKPSVRPPRTPSKSPPRRTRPPSPKPRPTGQGWSGPISSWQRDAAYWGTNKGRTKKEKQYYFGQGGRR